MCLLTALVIAMTGGAAAHGAPGPPGPAAAAERAGQGTARDTGEEGSGKELTGDIDFSVPSGTFQDELTVALGTAVPGAEIRYTTDGTLPTASSPLYSGPLELTATTQLRAQAFTDGAAEGEPGTALYVARSFDAAHDLPLLVMDAYGAGKPGREYADAAALLMEPESGTASLSAAPALATRAGFHLRGQSSAMFEKAPYRLEWWDNHDDDARHPVLGMPAEADWVLRGPFADKSLIRTALMYELGRKTGMRVPRHRFVEVYLNLDDGPLEAADYQGVYMITETIENSGDRLDLKELGEDDISEPAVTGGYVFKFEWFAAEEPTLACTGDAATCWRDLEVAEPSQLRPEQEEWLTGYVQGFHDSLRGEDPSDPRTGYPAYIDTDSFVDQVVLNELSREMDAYIRSQYFHKDREGKIFAGPLWDYNLTFGTGGYFGNQLIEGWQFEQIRQLPANDWFVRLMDDPSFVQRVDERWRTLRQGPLSDGALTALVDELAAPLTGAAGRNFARWPNLTEPMVGPFVTPTADTWQGQVDQLRDWMLRRAAWLDSSGWRPDAG
ncbi:CotH kinase family protein [Streptomyces sp. TRM 70361]|uniref:CotH kinase family protein n=1 Tax=Streptomyces sp. TRM 70361 TaxID=3116553 RepID=UPI002E7B8E6D|nr:CotH kinase family protein [Streptomyces sp. TRM 70361]MEE1938960.1 CotH kinase family protein [Streptomyces sp. TRM 70361]